MRLFTQLLILIFFFLIQDTCFSQNFPEYKFRTLSPDGGLGYLGVKIIKQDRYGFVWILMQNDIFRFDGYTYKRYTDQLNKLNPNSTNLLLNSIEEDASGNILIASGYGLFGLNRVTDSFESLLDGSIQKIKEDSSGNLWVVNNKGVNMFDLQNKELNLIEPHKKNTGSGMVVFSSEKGDFLMAKDSGRLYRLIRERMEFKLIYTIPAKSEISSLKRMDHYLWILTISKGLFMFNLKTMKLERTFTFFCNKGDERIVARSLFVDKSKNVWIGTQNGLYVLNPRTNEFSLYTRSDIDNYSLPNNSINGLNEDRLGNLWIGTYAGGVCYLNFNETSRFKTILIQSPNLNHFVVSSFAERGNEIWMGSEGNGLICYNKLTDKSTIFKHEPNKNSLAHNNVKALLLDKNQRLWLGMFRGGLDCLDLKTGKFKNFSDQDPDKRILFNHINRLEVEGDSGIWIGYLNIGARLTYFSLNRNYSEHYLFNIKGSQRIVGSTIADFCKDNENNLWIATQERLHVMNVKTRQVKVIPIDTLNDRSISNMNIKTIYWNKSDQSIWMGTNNSGLIKYNKKTGLFEYFPEIMNFNVHFVYSINSDNQNNMWIGTDNGLFKFDTRQKQFFQYGKEDGLQGHIFYPRASLKSSKGELYFGGTEGFSVVQPQNVKPNLSKPQIIISDFFIDNKSVSSDAYESPLNEYIGLTPKIILSHNQSNFGFEFSTTNFSTSKKTRFKYRLSGYDNDWIEVDATRRYVSYTKVPAGHYTFDVIVTNSDGLWVDTPKTIKIRVLPAPWASWWAYMIYLIIIGTIIYAIQYYYLKQKSLALELKWETNEMKRQEDNHQAQLRFYTNISHEFKTPLSLILGTLERQRQEASQLTERYFTIMGNNAKRLLNLINELMDFRTVENGKMNLRISSGSLNDFVIELASDFKEYAQQRNINFRIICDPALNNPVWIDRQIIEKIIMNLLNNAFKYTTKGFIVIETIADVSKYKSIYQNKFEVTERLSDSQMFGIVVRDTGIGISSQSISKVFDRFYMVNDPLGEQHLGSGVGLALVKSLVVLHKGSITLFSEREQGTDILAAFPLSKSEYELLDFVAVEDETEIPYIDVDNYQIESALPTNIESKVQDDDYLGNEKKRILLAEDNDDLRKLVAEALADQYEIIEAENGMTASNLLQEKEIDLIISDVMMPLKDGTTLCRETKQNISTSHIPFIMITAKGGLENRIEGIDSGADAFLEKPVNFKLLALTIKNIFKQQNNIKEFYAKNFYSETSEIKVNHRDNEFMKELVLAIESKIDQSAMDINYLAVSMSMSKSSLYAKVKSLTGKSIVEFIRYYRLRKAVKLLVEENLPIQDVMVRVGIESQSYFTQAFKKEFGENPKTFVANAKKKTN